MDRRKTLLLLAAVIAALGTALVVVYVQAADRRAEARFDSVNVLRAVSTIEPGESIDAARTAGKLALQPVPAEQVLATALTSTEAIAGQVALTRIFAGEQVIPEKFGSSVAGASAQLPIPEGMIAISVNLTDPARVAGFVNPNSQIAVFLTGPDPESGQPRSRMLLDRVPVIGVGSTTPIQTTITAEDGTTTAEALPKTLLTLAVTKAEAEKVLLAQSIGELAFGLTTEDSDLPAGPGAVPENLFR